MKKYLFYSMKMMVLAATLALAACATHKKAAETTAKPVADTNTVDVLGKIAATANNAEYVSSKLKFTVEVGALRQSLTGNLRMRRNDVICLQLMAFGFVEAGRLEFTRDSVLIIDRINKQYLHVPYRYLDFLRRSGINFYSLQAMFWNELFLPGQKQVTTDDYTKFTMQNSGEYNVLTHEPAEDKKMLYSWLADVTTGRIKMANVVYTPLQGSPTQLNWDYQHFSPLGRQMFPDDMKVTLTLPSKEVKIGVKLNYLGNDSEWEPRTKVSTKYTQVNVDEILRRFMAM